MTNVIDVPWWDRTTAYLRTGSFPPLPPLGPLGKAALVVLAVVLARWAL